MVLIWWLLVAICSGSTLSTRGSMRARSLMLLMSKPYTLSQKSIFSCLHHTHSAVEHMCVANIKSPADGRISVRAAIPMLHLRSHVAQHRTTVEVVQQDFLVLRHFFCGTCFVTFVLPFWGDVMTASGAIEPDLLCGCMPHRCDAHTGMQAGTGAKWVPKAVRGWGGRYNRMGGKAKEAKQTCWQATISHVNTAQKPLPEVESCGCSYSLSPRLLAGWRGRAKGEGGGEWQKLCN